MLFMPPWAIVHSRFWKAQVATMARSFRVVTYDGRGQRQVGAPRDERRVRRSRQGRRRACRPRRDGDGRRASPSCIAARQGRVSGSPPSIPTVSARWSRSRRRCRCPRRFPSGSDSRCASRRSGTRTGARRTFTTGRSEGGYDDYLRFFFGHCFPEPHSTKQIEDCVALGARDRSRDARDADGCARHDPGGGARPARERSRALSCSSREPRTRSRRPIGVRRCTLLSRARSSRSSTAAGTGSTRVTRSGSISCSATTPTGSSALPSDSRFAGPRPVRRGRSSSARRSASATPGATSRSPRSSAGFAPGSRSNGWPRIRSRSVLEAVR